MQAESKKEHDLLTVAAVACLAFVAADLSHEALGHGVVAWIGGARQIVLSYTYLSSDVQSRAISVAGPAMNVLEGMVAWLILRKMRMGSAATLFVFLLMNFNWLDAAAYLIYSGVLGSGDLAIVIAGVPHPSLVRAGMGVIGLGLYAGVCWLGGVELRRFAAPLGGLTGFAYFMALALNCLAALFNPLGLKYFLLSGLPATAGANAGLFAMPAVAKRGDGTWLVVVRSYVWIAVGLVAAGMFVLLIGRGIVLRG